MRILKVDRHCVSLRIKKNKMHEKGEWMVAYIDNEDGLKLADDLVETIIIEQSNPFDATAEEIETMECEMEKHNLNIKFTEEEALDEYKRKKED